METVLVLIGMRGFGSAGFGVRTDAAEKRRAPGAAGANQRCVQEYEIYLPTTRNDGAPVDAGEVERIKESLAKAFGGYTHLRQRSEGAWQMGGVTFRDEVTIVRVLDDGSSGFDMTALKRRLEALLQQEEVLIVSRAVEVL
jgi:hypothetical protein